MLKETLFFPELDPAEMEKLRADLLTEIESLAEDNLEYIKQEFYTAAYDGHPYGRPTCGTKQSIEGLDADAIALFHRQNWTPDRTVVAVVGDVKPREVADWVATRWADLGGTKVAPWRVDHPAPASWNPPGDQRSLELGKDYWTVNWGRPGCSYDDALYWPSVVLSRIAGNDHFYKYVYGEGVSYRSWIRFWENLAGTWILENDVKRERFDEILGMFDEDLTRYSTSGFTEKEHEDAVTRLVNSYVLDRQDNEMFAWRLAVEEGNGVGFRRTTQTPELLRGVKHAEVQELAREIFAPERVLRMVQR
jgi:zinc protease